jgi:hypothetical protein
MVINIGDIVRYRGKKQRVMSFYDGCSDTLRLSREDKGDLVRASNVTLIEPFIKPDIKTGDFVRILPIPYEEQDFYIDANKPIDGVHEVVDVRELNRCGTVIDIMENGEKLHYMVHCVEKVCEYDII